MITSRWFRGKEELGEIIDLRKKVFGKDSGEDFYDEFSFNLAIYEEDNNLIGIGRLMSKEGKFFIDNLGVKEEYRRKYYGDFMLRILIRKAHEIGIERIYIKCSEDVVNFFKKLDFVVENSKEETYLLSREGDISSGCCS